MSSSLSAPQVSGPHASAVEEPPSFRMLQTSFFANHSWAQSQGSGWLGELQTHGWDSGSGTIRFLWSWSRGNFSEKEFQHFQALLQLYFHAFPQEVWAFASQFQFEYPFELQISLGCRLHAGAASENFLNGAYQGSDLLSFQGNSWQPAPGAGSRAQSVCQVLNHYRYIKELVQDILRGSCPHLLASLLEAGKSELERQEKPEAWLSKGSSPGPGRLQLVCHVSGFHPKAVWVMWMRGEQEERGTQRGDVLPHADGTWYLRATLDVASGEAAGLACRVRHSSLGGQDMVLPWGEKELGLSWEMIVVPSPSANMQGAGGMGGHSILLLLLICLTVVGTLVMLVAADSWFKKQR
ncbi:T-cell surface glycoprotein CD1e, membrane-associated [Galemys pyrenaicus]|uniref:T-cell surface glycoprotein CD1e, membrane-associated n=1 Tax=Galemys pyrenaicus TaxID=202257 RepID=A0A8J5ZXI3_GALPY|nr:T-cell surface glycoprotein CD1e, membrane-associated [Galemys pyrenaicus]